MNDSLKKMIYAALCLALCMVLPFLTANNPMLGNVFCLMHIPVLLCGFICGPWWGLAVGAIAPLLRSVTIGMPPLFPTAVAMAVLARPTKACVTVPAVSVTLVSPESV